MGKNGNSCFRSSFSNLQFINRYIALFFIIFLLSVCVFFSCSFHFVMRSLWLRCGSCNVYAFIYEVRYERINDECTTHLHAK